MDDQPSVFDALFHLGWQFVKAFPGAIAVGAAFFATVVLLPRMLAILLWVALMALALRTGVSLLDVLTARSRESRISGKIRRSASELLDELAVPYSSVDVSVNSIIRLRINGDRETMLGLAPAIASRCGMVGWRVGASESLAFTDILLWEVDPLAHPIGAFSEVNFESGDDFLLGVDEMGSEVRVSADDVSVLISGVPGSGKSCIAAFIHHASERGNTCVAIDLKSGVEFERFRGCRGVSVVSSPSEALEELRKLVSWMDDRYVTLRGLKARKAEDAGLPPVWLVIDEVQQLTNPPNRQRREEGRRLLADLLARGRAAGLVVVVGTQHASGEVLSTQARDLFRVRIAFHQVTSEGWKMALGRRLEASAPAISSPGLGFMTAEGSDGIIRIRTFEMTDEFPHEGIDAL